MRHLSAPTPFVLLVLLLALLVGCGPQAEVDATTQKSAYEELTGIVTMADYMSLRYANFDAFDEGIQSGKSIPASLRLYIANKADGYCHDEDVIVRMWNALKETRIDVDKTWQSTTDENYISFSFDSGEELISFAFGTTGFAEFADDEVYPVEDSAAVQALVDELLPLVEVELPKPGDEVPLENGAYVWDADDDGMPEHMWVSFIDNGDEAPSVLEVRVFGKNFDVSGYIDGGYSVLGVRLAQDDAGPYVIVDCTAGDYYYHDHEMQRTIRVVNNELVVEPPSPSAGD